VSSEVEERECREPGMTDKVGKVISACKEREPIVAKNGDTIAGYNNVITLAPTLIVSDDDLAVHIRNFEGEPVRPVSCFCAADASPAAGDGTTWLSGSPRR
jgi:hypothetical protein